MLSLGQLIPFLLAVALIELTPGPNMGYLAVVASQSGRGAGMATVAGVTLGLVLYLMASVFGLSEAAMRWPWIYQTLRWAGVAYLLWLAVDTWRGASPEASPPPDHRSLFLRGLLNNLLNPKAAVFYVALLPGFIRPQDGLPLVQALVLGSIHIMISVLIHTTIVLTASHARSALQSDNGKSRVFLQRAFAVGLAAIALWLAISTPDAAPVCSSVPR